MDTYQSDLTAYDVAVKAHDDCVLEIQVRESYREIFYGVDAMFQNVASIPDSAFATPEDAAEYERLIREGSEALIAQQVADLLPPRVERDCPQIPDHKPVKPNK